MFGPARHRGRQFPVSRPYGSHRSSRVPQTSPDHSSARVSKRDFHFRGYWTYLWSLSVSCGIVSAMATATLSARHKAFAHAYSASHNATAAAREAGYAANRASRTGYELLHRPDIAALVERLDTAKRDATGVDELWIVQRLVEIVERSMQGLVRTIGLGEPVVDAESGAPIIDTDYTNANRALATLAKITGLQTRRTAVEHTGRVVYRLELDRVLPGAEQ